jgi:glycosyltransferase involved in cell wall biosynthesis
MVPYKRLDLAIEACNRAAIPLVVAGSGPAEGDLRALASRLRADVRFVINPDDATLRELYRASDVFVFPPVEDFGIVAVEAQACGTPVVACGLGGTRDTIIPGSTGVLVDEQSAESLSEGIQTVVNRGMDRMDCRRNAERFSRRHFEDAFLNWVVTACTTRDILLADPRTRDLA